MIINLALLVVALKILGVKFMVKTIYAIFTLYFLLKFAQMLMPVDTAGHYIKILGPNQDFMSLLIGCCFTGTALAVVFMNNGSTGGTDIIAACVNKYRDVSLGQVLMAVDFLIIGRVCFFFPQFGDIISRLHKVVFGLCTMVVENFMLDHVMNIQRQSVQFMIFSKKSKEIAHAIGTQTRTRHHHPRWPWLVHRTGDEGAVYPRPQAGKHHHLPHHQDDRPRCFCFTEQRHRRVR